MHWQATVHTILLLHVKTNFATLYHCNYHPCQLIITIRCRIRCYYGSDGDERGDGSRGGDGGRGGRGMVEGVEEVTPEVMETAAEGVMEVAEVVAGAAVVEAGEARRVRGRQRG